MLAKLEGLWSIKHIFAIAAVVLGVLLTSSITRAALPESPLSPVGSGFSYQGRLTESGSPANGQSDFDFGLYDASTGGGQVSSLVTVTNQLVSDGLFTVQLDFGLLAFQGEAR